MADTVNGQSSGYEVLDNLKNIHSKILTELSNEIKDTKELIGEENGFYVEETCKKIDTLLNALETKILPTIETSFSTSEKSVESMEKVLTSNDHF